MFFLLLNSLLVQEYRDIPSDQDTDNSILANIKTDSRSDIENPSSRNQLFDGKLIK